MIETASFIQVVGSFEGKGIRAPVSLDPIPTYTVSSDKRCQLTYFRAGNSTVELIYFIVQVDGVTMRYFPVGAKSAVHIALAVTEDLPPGSQIQILVGAPDGCSGDAVLDIGFTEF